MTVTALHKQTYADLAVQENGTLEAIVAFAFANNMSLTDELEGGMEITLPKDAANKPNNVNYYKAYKVKPATDLSDDVIDIVNNEDPCNLCKCFI